MQGRAAGRSAIRASNPEPWLWSCPSPAAIGRGHLFRFRRRSVRRRRRLGIPFRLRFQGQQTGTETVIADWALSREDEKAAFERFVDFVIARLEAYPDLHIYHYAPYEPAALKRLMGRYVTREDEIDRMLRGGVFVDLYAVVRHAIRASVESYSIKSLSPCMTSSERWDFPEPRPFSPKCRRAWSLAILKASVRKSEPRLRATTEMTVFRRGDCATGWKKSAPNWWPPARNDRAAGAAIWRSGRGPHRMAAEDRRLIERLTQDVPVDRAERSHEQHGRWLLAHILDWHRRENKAAWWEYYRLSALRPMNCLTREPDLSGSRSSARSAVPKKRQSIAIGFRLRIPIYAAAKSCVESAERSSARSRRSPWRLDG